MTEQEILSWKLVNKIELFNQLSSIYAYLPWMIVPLLTEI